MASDNEVQIVAPDAQSAQRSALCAIDEVLRIERKYSRYRADSITSRINAAAGRHAVEVDGETAALLDYAGACHGESNGLFDITSGVLRRAWDFTTPRLPAPDELAALLPLVGREKVRWQKPALFLPQPGMQIDFGGIGKEYAAARAAAALRQTGATHALSTWEATCASSARRRTGERGTSPSVIRACPMT